MALTTCKRKRDAEGYCHWQTIGGDSFKSALKKAVNKAKTRETKRGVVSKMAEKALLSMSATQEEYQVMYPYLRLSLLELTKLASSQELAELETLTAQLKGSGVLSLEFYQKGKKFSRVGFGDGMYINKVFADWLKYTNAAGGDGAPADEFRFPNGHVFGWMYDCLNMVFRHEAPVIPPAPQPAPPPATPTPVGEVPKNITPNQALGYLIDEDNYDFVGQTRNHQSHTTFYGANVGIYPFVKDVPGGRHEVGVSGFWNGFTGETFDHFRFGGERAGVGPAYKYFNWPGGYDVRAALFYGWLNNDGHTGDTKFQQGFSAHMAGVDMGINWYPRQLHGNPWFSKTSAWFRLGVPFDQQSRASYEGRPVSSDQHLGAAYSLGARQYIYDFSKWFRLYGELGLFGELPVSHSLTPALGVSINDMVFLGIGSSLDMLHNFNPSLWYMGGVDPFAIGRYIDGKVRRDQWVSDLEANGVSFDEDTGILTIPQEKTTKPTAAHASGPTAQFDPDSGVLTIP